MRKRHWAAFTRAAGLALAVTGGPAAAGEYEIGGATLTGINRFTIGAGVRVEEQDPDRLGKLNVPGQQTLCQADDCLSLNGNTAPNDRLKGGRGGYFLHSTDDGNMAYEPGDLVTALGKINSDWTLNWDDWTFRTAFVGFFDAANHQSQDRHHNTLWQPATVPRSGEFIGQLGMRGEFREYFAATAFEVAGREWFASAGHQRVRWGEANLTLLNTLDVINPQDAVLARQPGLALNELNLPVGLVSFGTDVAPGITVDAFYQYDWEAVRPEPAGSFYSTSDVAGGGVYGIIALGQYAEDPDARFVSRGSTGLVSSSHRTIYLTEQLPADGGQVGLRLKWYLEEFMNGTELGFYFANYHSRLPYLSATGAIESCARDSRTFTEAFVDCNGFNSGLHPADSERCDPRGCDLPAYAAREPLPVDTLGLFLEYPEDIRMFGVSFNNTVLGWSVSGEYSFRPNLPAQILISDVVHTGLQPAFPREEIPIESAGAIDPRQLTPAMAARLANLLADQAQRGPEPGSKLPAGATFVPSYIERYRGQPTQPGQRVPGFERLQVGQFAINALKLYSTNPFGSDDVLVLGEIGFTHVLDMPSGLALQGAGDFSHPSPGADGTGENDGNTTPQNTARINPTQQTEGFAEEFAWGVRGFVQLNYSDIFDLGLSVKPTLLAFYDVDGIAPSPMQNYVEGSAWIVPAAFFEVGSDFSGSLLYQYFAGPRNLLSDRDSLSFSIAYSF